MKWSKTAPEKPGWYWWRRGRSLGLHVVHWTGNFASFGGWGPTAETPEDFRGEWGDEIPPPAPEPWVPTEAGLYYATLLPTDARVVVEFYTLDHIEYRGRFLKVGEFTDWSERLTDPGPKKSE